MHFNPTNCGRHTGGFGRLSAITLGAFLASYCHNEGGVSRVNVGRWPKTAAYCLHRPVRAPQTRKYYKVVGLPAFPHPRDTGIFHLEFILPSLGSPAARFQASLPPTFLSAATADDASLGVSWRVLWSRPGPFMLYGPRTTTLNPTISDPETFCFQASWRAASRGQARMTADWSARCASSLVSPSGSHRLCWVCESARRPTRLLI